MKIRNGFVSNSSSSSFIIVGCKLDPKYYKTIVEKYVDPEYIEDTGEIYCCEQKLETLFCPHCGKRRGELQSIINYEYLMSNEVCDNVEGFITSKLDELPMIGIELEDTGDEIINVSFTSIETAKEKIERIMAEFEIEERIEVIGGTYYNG